MWQVTSISNIAQIVFNRTLISVGILRWINTNHFPHLWILICFLALALVSFSSGIAPLSQSLVIDTVWDALEPNTSSHNRENWEAVEVRQVVGQEVTEIFEGEPAPGCWSGPTPPANEIFRLSDSYWFVQMKPRPVTPLPQEGTTSPTAPPLVAEPFLWEAFFLVDANHGEIVARKLHCVIY